MARPSLVKNTLLLSAGEALRVLINFIAVPLFSSWLSTGDYGTFDLVITYVSLFIPFITLANSESLFRLGVETKDKSELEGLINTSLLIDAIGYGCVALAVAILSVFASSNLAIPFLLLLAGQVGLEHLRGCMRALRKLNLYALANAISSIAIFVSVSVLVFILKQGLSGILYGYAIGNLVGCVAALVLMNYRDYFNPSSASFGEAKRMLAYSLPLVPNNISWWVINVSDRSMIGLMIGSAANGIYAVACKVPNLCSTVFSVFGISWQEAATDMADTRERNAYYNEIFNKTTVVMLSLCAVVLMLTYPLFDLFFDPRYHEATVYVPILVTSVAMNSIGLYFGGIQISLKRPKENGLTTAIGAVVNVLLNIFLIPVFGIFAAAFSTLAANAIIAFTRYWHLKSDIRFSYNRSSVCAIFIYCLFIIWSYFTTSYAIFAIGFVAAACFFIIVNNEFLRRLSQRLSRMIH